ncbi:MAG: FAD-dependent oxidoreductase [Reyranellales bacterium]
MAKPIAEALMPSSVRMAGMAIAMFVRSMKDSTYMTKATPRIRTQRFLCGARLVVAATTFSPQLRQRILLPKVSDHRHRGQQTRLRPAANISTLGGRPFSCHDGRRCMRPSWISRHRAIEGERGIVITNDRVLIVGAGPVGLVLAYRLGAARIPVTLVEALPDLAQDLRASTFHPPTLEMLDEIGVVQRMIATGVVAPTFQYRDRRDGRIIGEFDFGVLRDDTRFPFRVQCEQFKVARYIYERLRTLPDVAVRFAARATAVRQDANGVGLTIETPAGAEELTGRYLLGADGANSAVRGAVGIELEGFTWPERFLVLSTPFDFAAVIDRLAPVSYYADPDEWCFCLRVPDLWRVMFPVKTETTEDTLASPELAERLLQGFFARDVRYDIRHRTLYRVHQRIASNYRAGRVLLAGDAAHLNNPLGGMGLNSGIHDAVNLADTLTAVWRGANDALLDRYTRQRRPIALEHVDAQSRRNKAFLEERDPGMRRRSLDEIRRIAEDPQAAYLYVRKAAMIDSLRQAAALA